MYFTWFIHFHQGWWSVSIPSSVCIRQSNRKICRNSSIISDFHSRLFPPFPFLLESPSPFIWLQSHSFTIDGDSLINWNNGNAEIRIDTRNSATANHCKFHYMSFCVCDRLSSSFIEQLFMIKSSMNWRFCKMAKRSEPLLSWQKYKLQFLASSLARLQNQNNVSPFRHVRNGILRLVMNSLIELKFRVIWFVATVELHLARKQLKAILAATNGRWI